MHLNTAVSSLMELVNDLYSFSERTAHGAPSRGGWRRQGTSSGRRRLQFFAKRSVRWSVMISPFAPHTGEELWEMLGHRGGLTKQPGQRSMPTWRGRTRSWCRSRLMGRFAPADGSGRAAQIACSKSGQWRSSRPGARCKQDGAQGGHRQGTPRQHRCLMNASHSAGVAGPCRVRVDRMRLYARRGGGRFCRLKSKSSAFRRLSIGRHFQPRDTADTKSSGRVHQSRPYQIPPRRPGSTQCSPVRSSGISLQPASFSQTPASRYAITMTARVELRETQGILCSGRIPAHFPAGMGCADQRRQSGRPRRVSGPGHERARAHDQRICADNRQRDPRGVLTIFATTSRKPETVLREMRRRCRRGDVGMS